MKKRTFIHGIRAFCPGFFRGLVAAGCLAWLLVQAHCAKYEHQPLAPSMDGPVVTGFAQKGPFVTGTTVICSPLNERFEPVQDRTGMVENDAGYFTVAYSPEALFHEIIVQGHCYNENAGRISEGSFSLSTLFTHTLDREVNVNVITTLTGERIKTLIQDGSLSLEEAILQAEQEILAVFRITDPGIHHFCRCSIAETGESDAALLAVSLVVLGHRDAETCLSLIEALSADLKADGEISDTTLIRQLKENARQLNLRDIRRQMETFYQTIQAPFAIPLFERYALRLLPFYISETLPGPGAASVDVETAVRVQFNKELLDPLNVQPWLSLTADGLDVSGRWTVDSLGQTLSFEPDSAFSYATVYALTLSAELSAFDSTRLGSTGMFTFTTESAPVLGPLPDSLLITGSYDAIDLTVTNAGGDTLFWQLKPGPSWLSVRPQQGAAAAGANQSVHLTVDTTGLEPGRYSGYLEFISAGGADSVQIILQLPSHPVLKVTHNAPYAFGYHQTEAAFEIMNQGTGMLHWQVTSDQPWLHLAAAEGRTGKFADRVEFQVNRSGLEGGRYTALILIDSDGGKETFDVTIDVIHRLIISAAAGGRDASICNLPCDISPEVYDGPCRESNLALHPMLRIESWTISGYQGTYRSFLQFDLSALNAESLVDSAFLQLMYSPDFNMTHSGDNGFFMDRLVTAWDESSVNWENQPEVSGFTTAEYRVSVAESSSGTQNYKAALTQMVQYWQSHPSRNFGVRLALKTEQFYRRIAVGSSHSDVESGHPRLVIYYRTPSP